MGYTINNSFLLPLPCWFRGNFTRCQGFGVCCQILQSWFVCAIALCREREVGADRYSSIEFQWHCYFPVKGSDSVKLTSSQQKVFSFGHLPLLLPLFAWFVFWAPVCQAGVFSEQLFTIDSRFRSSFECSFLWLKLQDSVKVLSGFRSAAVLVNKPWGNPAKYNLHCCGLCMFTKCYCFDSVLEDMFLL